jgi:hypothetical protein
VSASERPRRGLGRRTLITAVPMVAIVGAAGCTGPDAHLAGGGPNGQTAARRFSSTPAP